MMGVGKMNKDDGGPAFPSHGTMGEVVCEGMTLRDYFAAKAMQAMASAPIGKFTHSTFSELTGSAYALADAMLAERAK
jgi:hypothetical protein